MNITMEDLRDPNESDFAFNVPVGTVLYLAEADADDGFYWVGQYVVVRVSDDGHAGVVDTSNSYNWACVYWANEKYATTPREALAKLAAEDTRYATRLLALASAMARASEDEARVALLDSVEVELED